MSNPRKPSGKNATYVLRTVSQEMTSYGEFVWPKSGFVAAPDWDPAAKLGNGLHGLLMGAGEGGLLNFSGIWLVCLVDARTVVNLGGKVKFPHCWVEFCGAQHDATNYIVARGADPATCVGHAATAGDCGTATAGHRGTATAGDGGTIIIKWRDGGRCRLAVGYIGEAGLKPNTPYKLDDNGKFIEVEQ